MNKLQAEDMLKNLGIQILNADGTKRNRDDIVEDIVEVIIKIKEFIHEEC